jgi:hypothetical protein
MTLAYLPTIFESVHPSAGTLTIAATIPDGSNCFGNIIVSNTSSVSSDLFSVAISTGGLSSLNPAPDSSQYIAYNTQIYPNGQVILPNIGLDSNSQIIVSSLNGLVSFNTTGNKIIN